MDNKRDEKGLLGMKGSYITTPRYLMHSVKGQEWEGQTKIVTEWATEKSYW